MGKKRLITFHSDEKIDNWLETQGYSFKFAKFIRRLLHDFIDGKLHHEDQK